MSQHSLDGENVRSRADRQACGRVPEIVRRDSAERGILDHGALDRGGEPPVLRIRSDEVTVPGCTGSTRTGCTHRLATSHPSRIRTSTTVGATPRASRRWENSPSTKPGAIHGGSVYPQPMVSKSRSHRRATRVLCAILAGLSLLIVTTGLLSAFSFDSPRARCIYLTEQRAPELGFLDETALSAVEGSIGAMPYGLNCGYPTPEGTMLWTSATWSATLAIYGGAAAFLGLSAAVYRLRRSA